MRPLGLVLGIALWPLIMAVKVALVLVGLVAVRYTDPDRGMWRRGFGRPDTWWERAIRNPVGGFDHMIRHPDSYNQWGEVREAPFTLKRFQWRVRYSGLLVSVRLLWQYNHERYGELYVGWKLGSNTPLLDFAMSLRPWATSGA